KGAAAIQRGSVIREWTRFAGIHSVVLKPRLRTPGERAFLSAFVVAELKAVDRTVRSEPDDQIEVVVRHPTTIQVIWDGTDRLRDQHGWDLLSTPDRRVLYARKAFD